CTKEDATWADFDSW
nr:immunoglobulin heavy chain junction region [Macaca mulatta]MOW75107.1 immunoglobulin heavy chain junction region [Macaca mulatta]MOW75147.1 immunoglobulin heavy chain junction region [Macaca mulatta]MOW75160.1 immunoglobulin heavy chain junction region [Macaca mulatta]MOW75170.1 immunoglobulin heavy chain junction region [Macaca mulatta]